jgi:hypothetical protein
MLREAVPVIATAARSTGFGHHRQERQRGKSALGRAFANAGQARRAAAVLAFARSARHTEMAMPQANALSFRDGLRARVACPSTPRCSVLVAAGSPNQSIERTFQSVLRTLWPAAHLQR